jgi:hypothetical protein
MERRFRCTPGGAILRGRSRLKRALMGLAVLMLTLSLAAGAAGRRGPAFAALAVALIPWTAWRLGGHLDPFWVGAGGGWLTVESRRRQERFAAAGAEARRLKPGEVSHLETLAAGGWVAVGWGGFESHRLGEFDLYASDLAQAVLVDLGATRLILTPDDPEGFLEALSSP